MMVIWFFSFILWKIWEFSLFIWKSKMCLGYLKKSVLLVGSFFRSRFFLLFSLFQSYYRKLFFPILFYSTYILYLMYFHVIYMPDTIVHVIHSWFQAEYFKMSICILLSFYSWRNWDSEELCRFLKILVSQWPTGLYQPNLYSS